ncbi:hypothetical protein BVRB_3g055280 [Beta vulgaris subsp. vulgaris]|nr:hypothetical protein BVRB_3g055280 [Beta vulgaris subsp. vulgaris]
MANSMVGITRFTTKMIDRWTTLLASSSKLELDMEKEITILAGEIIAKTNFGINNELGQMLFEKLRAMQIKLFKHTRYDGVPFGHLLTMRHTLEVRRLEQKIDDVVLSIINARIKEKKG